MATKKAAVKKPATTKRRPASKQSSLSAASKKSVATKQTVKKTTRQAKPAASVTKKSTKPARQTTPAKKKPATKPRKVVAKQKAAPAKATKQVAKKKVTKKVVRKTRAVRRVSLPLTRKTQLTITLHPTKPAPKKKATKAKTAKPKRSKTKELVISLSLVMLGLSGSVFFGLRAFAVPSAPTVNVVAKKSLIAPVLERVLPRSEPTRLSIPDAQIDASLLAVDTESNGSIHVPIEDNTAGWYKQSPTPGEAGSSIIVGHLDTIYGLGVFWRLHELSPGQIINIDRQDNTTAHFMIEKIEQYSQADFPSSKVYSGTNRAELRLITCGGTFNRLTGHYSDNLVLYAALIPQKSITTSDTSN